MSLSESVESASEKIRLAAETRIMVAILSLLTQEGELSQEQIRSKIPGNAQLKLECLKNLIDGGEVRKTGSGQRGEPYSYSLMPIRSEIEAFPLPVAA